MPDVPLASIRIGWSYAVDLTYPAGFLQAGESIRSRLRRFVGDTEVVDFADDRVGDTITWTLTEAQTAGMTPGTYYAEGELYDTADPAAKGEVLTDNRYVISVDHSVSE